MKRFGYFLFGALLVLTGTVWAITTGRNASNIEEYVCSVSNALCVYVANNPAAFNVSKGALDVSRAGTTRNFNTTGDKQCVGACGPGSIERIVVNSNTLGTVKFYDNAGATCNSGGTLLSNTWTFTTSTAPIVIEVGFEYSTGLCMTLGGTIDITTITYP